MRFIMSFGEIGKILFVGIIIAAIIFAIFSFTKLLDNLLWFFFFLLLTLAVVFIVIERFSDWT